MNSTTQPTAVNDAPKLEDDGADAENSPDPTMKSLARQPHISFAAALGPTMAAALAVLAIGCAPTQARTPTISLAEAAPESRIARYPLALVVHKSQLTVSIYRHGIIRERYAAVFGQQANGDKLYEGDLRTPEGLYRITGKRRHPRWHYFLDIDYPNSDDRARYRQNLADGRIPVIRDKVLGIGSGLGIHGSDRPVEQHDGTNWTRGCVALSNKDIEALQKRVKVGTPVLILP